MREIVALSGFKNSGKDTAGNLITEILGDNTRIIAFADPIKKAASEIFGIPHEILLGRTPENRKKRDELDEFWSQYIDDFTGRKALTMIGTDVIREYVLDEIWILRLKREIEDNPNTNFVITDLREPNEEQTLYSLQDENTNVTHLNIHKDDCIPSWTNIAIRAALFNDEIALGILEKKNIHPSEWKQVALNPTDKIYNNGTISDMAKKLENYFK